MSSLLKTLVASLALIVVVMVILWFTVFSDETKDGISNDTEDIIGGVQDILGDVVNEGQEVIENLN